MRPHMEGVLLLVVSLVFARSVQADAEEEDCKPTSGVRLSQCCKITTEIVPPSMVTKYHKCLEKYPDAKPRKGPPPSGPPPKSSYDNMKRGHVCVKECVYTREGLLTYDNKLDTEAVAEYFTSTDADLNGVVKSAVTECLQIYQSSLNNSMECTSGAAEFDHCLGWQVFQNCPKTMWEATPECEVLKTNAPKCQMIHFHMTKSIRP